MDSSLEDLVDWTSSLVACSIDDNLKDVTSSGTAVEEGVTRVNGQTVDKPSIMSKLYFKRLELVRLVVNCPEFDGTVVTCDESIALLVVEGAINAFLTILVSCRLSAL
jgi:hypothetical protein